MHGLWHVPGVTRNAPRDETPINELDMSFDEITNNLNPQIFELFKRDKCCKDIKKFIEFSFKDNYDQTLYLFVNDAQTHYFLGKKPLVLNNVKIEPLLTYNHDNFSIVHNNMLYSFKVDKHNSKHHYYDDEYKDNNKFITITNPPRPIAFFFSFNTKNGETLYYFSYTDEVYILFKIIDNNYVPVTNFTDLIRHGIFFNIIYDAIIYYFEINNNNGTISIQMYEPEPLRLSFKKRSKKRSKQRSKQRSKKRSKQQRSKKRSKQRSKQKRSKQRSKQRSKKSSGLKLK